MSTIDMRSETSMQVPDTGTLDFTLEVVVVPVSDAERAKRFYASLGWREDADFVISEDYRVLQFTPPGSQASIIFGTGVTAAAPGSIDSLLLAVADIDAAASSSSRMPYLSAREQGSTPDEANSAAALYMQESRGVVGPHMRIAPTVLAA